MNFGNTALFQVAKAKMAYLGQRQATLAVNIANVDTPGFKARDVKAPDFKAMMKQARSSSVSTDSTMSRTHKMHLSPASQRGAYTMIDRVDISENNPNRNGVNIDNELQKVAFTQAEYGKVVSIYRKNISLVRTAIGNPNGG